MMYALRCFVSICDSLRQSLKMHFELNRSNNNAGQAHIHNYSGYQIKLRNNCVILSQETYLKIDHGYLDTYYECQFHFCDSNRNLLRSIGILCVTTNALFAILHLIGTKIKRDDIELWTGAAASVWINAFTHVHHKQINYKQKQW